MSKHIVISCEGGDFSMDLIFAGLVRRFGKENVIDFPSRQKFRQGKPKLVGDAEKDYGAERRSLSYVEGCEDLREYSYQEVLDYTDSHRCADLGNEQATIWMDETEESMIHWLRFAQCSSKKPRTVIIAGHDSFRGDPAYIHERFHGPFREFGRQTGQLTLFIDDWKSEYDNIPGAHLINLSCNFDHLWEVERREEFLTNKIYDICFIGYNSNPVRKVVIDHVRKKWGHLNNYLVFEEQQDKFDMFMRHDEMFRIMAQSKICLNLPGASTGGRALRYYEIPYVGSFMLSRSVKTKLLQPTMHSPFGTLDMLDQVVKNYFKDEENFERLARNDHNNCMKYHTIDARMDYIFSVLDG